MPRVSDVDKVAPDDLVVVTPTTKKVDPTPPESPTPTSDSKSQPQPNFRQRVYDILGHTTNPFASFIVRPKVFTFEERDLDEEIILVARQHWFTNLRWIVIAIIMAFIPSLLHFSDILATFTPQYHFAANIFWYLITFIFAFEKFLGWYFNVYIITDERVVDIDFNNLLDKKFSEAKISMIQDVTSQVVGLSQTMFNYGSVFIQTASEVPEIEFQKVANPQKIIKVLQQLRQEEELENLQGRVR